MAKIKQLSKHIINQIAAGEVIERPMSIVKEFVENSIDAHATKIEIAICNKCLNIRVADNGTGIDEEDIELAFSKHATSKIETTEDLFNVNSLGFRGEALASIISVSKLSCTTKTADTENGIKVECENSETKKSVCACANGTIMDVKDLFYNTPARLKFLKNEKTELSYITEFIQAIALSFPQISFHLLNENNTVLKTSGSGDILTTIGEIYTSAITKELKEIDMYDLMSKIKVKGYASTPDYTRASKKSMYIFVNNRVVKCPIIQKAISNAYKALLPQGKYPFIVIYLELPTSDIDVNAHPTKKEIRYKNPNQIYGIVYSAILKAINSYSVSSHTNFSQYNNSNYQNIAESIQTDYSPNFQPQEVFAENSTTNFNANVPETFVNHTTENDDYVISNVNQQAFNLEIQEIERPKYRIIGQIANSFILIEHEDCIEFVDQHIAEERFYFEQLSNQQEIASQLLLFDDEKQLEPSDINLLKENIEQLEKYGYKIEFLSDTSLKFKKIPLILSHVKTYDILPDLLKNLHDAKTDIATKILATIACHASIKAGQELTLWQMEDVIKRWQTTKQPYTCPHGRPISKKISKKEVASYFLRVCD